MNCIRFSYYQRILHSHSHIEEIVSEYYTNNQYQVIKAEKLEGGVSTTTYKLTLHCTTGGNSAEALNIIQKQYDTKCRTNIACVFAQYHILKLLQSTEMKSLVPSILHCSATNEIEMRSSSNLFLLLEYKKGYTLDGNERAIDRAGLTSYLRQIAAKLFGIHSVDLQRGSSIAFSLGNMLHEFEERVLGARKQSYDSSLSEKRIVDLLRDNWPFTQSQPFTANEQVLLHGDFWPGNILWNGSDITAIIDWEDVCVGDALFDVANCRLELLWLFGEEAMNLFTASYKAICSSANSRTFSFQLLPFWDLCAALKPAGKLDTWPLSAEELRDMKQKHATFVDNAIRQYAALLASEKSDQM